MPKIVITERNLPLALHTLDKWKGKLTWGFYAAKLAEVLGVGSISRHTLLKYPEITQAFELKKQQLADKKSEGVVDDDARIAMLQAGNEALEAKINRLEDTVNRYKEQFVRWQSNLYMMPGVDMEKLDSEINKPLVAVDRGSE
jgi:hypothetical protein